MKSTLRTIEKYLRQSSFLKELELMSLESLEVLTSRDLILFSCLTTSLQNYQQASQSILIEDLRQ